ncbi:MAG: peptidylprolyl isomerase [Bacteroidales bacterium]|nr:peptidylprolyl isomerase [Bacteroidales bacterium]
MKKIYLYVSLLFTLTFAMTQAIAAETEPKKDVEVEMETTMGNIRLLLYGDTPKHLDNFVKLVNEGFYDGVLFHRVINDFMIQGGDPDSKDAPAGKLLGEGDPGYRIDAEFVYPKHFHKRGALAAAREGDMTNPQKQSSGSQFYIVTGKVLTPEQLDQLNARRLLEQKKAYFGQLNAAHRDTIVAMRRSRDREGLQALQEEMVAETEAYVKAHPDTLTAEQREVYTTIGGTPHLDGSYTVFGEVLSGMDVVDKIQKSETDRNDRPLQDVRILKMKVINQ